MQQGYSISGEIHVGAYYTEEEQAFLMWMERYQRLRRRPFPTCREILAIIHAMGYRRVEPATDLPAVPPAHGESGVRDGATVSAPVDRRVSAPDRP